MKKMKLMRVVLSAALVGVLSFGQYAFAASGVPGAGATLRDRVNPLDSNGHELAPNVTGYKVFVTSGTTSLTQVVDEAGVAPVAGTIHAVCVDAGTATESAVVFDSATASGLTAAANGTKMVAPAVYKATANERCLVVDAGFHKGAVVLNSFTIGASWVYWRPIGRRQ